MKLKITWAILPGLAFSLASCKPGAPVPEMRTVARHTTRAASNLSANGYPNQNLLRLPTSPALSEIESKLQKRGITLVYTADVPHTSQCTFTVAPAEDREEVRGYAAMLAEEMSKYSPATIKKIQLQKIEICKDLRIVNVVTPGLADPEHNILLMDYKLGNYDDDYQRHAIHHELLHFMMGQLSSDQYDAEWAEMNEPGFKYGSGGRYARGHSEGVLDHPRPGFVDAYAETAEQEDMAEMQACRMMPKEFALLKTWMVHDRYLQYKYERLLAILQPFGA